MDASDSIDFCTIDIASRYPQIDPEVEGVVGRLSAINKHVSRTFDETLARHGLNHGEYRLLLRLTTRSEDQQMTAGELGRALLLSSGAMTNRIDRLETAGLVERVRDPRDRRGVLVALTDKGKTTIEHAVTEQAAKEIDVMSVLGATELKQLNKLLRKVLSSLEETAEGDHSQAGERRGSAKIKPPPPERRSPRQPQRAPGAEPPRHVGRPRDSQRLQRRR